MDKCLIWMSIGMLVLSVVLGAMSSYWWFLVEPPALPEEEIKEMAARFYGVSSTRKDLKGIYNEYVDQPMVGKVVIITGATSGVGESLAFNMFKMGATVVVTGRSQEKVDKTISEFKLDYPFSEGILYAKELDVSDLESVHKFSHWVKDKFAQLHILINNAGIKYDDQDMAAMMETPLRSKQGYDLLFATNYLGHFLLTDLLLPLLRTTANSRIMQVSSNAQYLLHSGDDLNTEGGIHAPLLALPQPVSRMRQANMDHERRWGGAYGPSKLAQVMHAIELQKELNSDNDTDLKIFSYSPGLTYTGMFRDNVSPLFLRFLKRLAYSADASVYAAMSGLFSADLKGGDEYWNNCPSFFLHSSELARSLLAIARDGNRPALFAVLILSAFYQQLHYGEITVSPVHWTCYDSTLTEGLFKWSRAEVSKYVFDFNNSRAVDIDNLG